MTKRHRTLWSVWAVFAALLALELAVPYVVPRRQYVWHPAQTALAGFVLALFSLAAAEGTFALREALVLRDVPADALQRRSVVGSAQFPIMRVVTLWALCLLIGFFGSLIAYGSATPTAAVPYVVAAAVLLVVHAPGRRLLASLGDDPRPSQPADAATPASSSGSNP